MTDPRGEGGRSEPGPEGDLGLGEPIHELAELVETPTAGFAGRVRNSILRRGLTSDLVDYAWTGPLRVFWEYVEMLFGLFGHHASGKEEKE